MNISLLLVKVEKIDLRWGRREYHVLVVLETFLFEDAHGHIFYGKLKEAWFEPLLIKPRAANRVVFHI